MRVCRTYIALAVVAIAVVAYILFMFSKDSTFKPIEGLEDKVALTAPQYYVLRTVVGQIRADDPSFANTFDVSAVIQLPFVSGDYLDALSGVSGSTVATKFERVQALLDADPAKNALKSRGFGTVLVPTTSSPPLDVQDASSNTPALDSKPKPAVATSNAAPYAATDASANNAPPALAALDSSKKPPAPSPSV
jgi:hypothetical protein